MAVIVLAALGLGTLLAALNVAYRDFRYVIPFLVQVGMFATPTVYMQPTGRRGAGGALALDPEPDDRADRRLPGAPAGRPDPLGRRWASPRPCRPGCSSAGCLYFRKVEDSFADII